MDRWSHSVTRSHLTVNVASPRQGQVQCHTNAGVAELTSTVITRGRPAEVDYAEGIAVRVAEDDEVRLRRIQPPVEPACPESDEPLNLGFLLGSGIYEQVKVNTRMRLHRRLTAL